MSRLDSNIERLLAQRACLDELCTSIGELAGPVVELGLGNGRTFDHLRERLPGREIFVFERQPAAHPDCTPDGQHLIVGDFFDTLPEAHRRLPTRAALLHSDIGTGDAARNARLAGWLAGVIPDLVAPLGFVASDQRLNDPRLTPWALPDSVRQGRYHLYRRTR